jgi:hypothetical protein
MTKTWYTQANIPCHASASTDDIAKSFWFNLKTFLCNENTSGSLSTSTGTRPASSNWVVVSSSNGVSHGTTDYWGTVYNSTNFVSAAYNASHSWCILKNVQNGYHLVLDMSSTTNTTGRLTAASGAIAGGSLQSPAATSETFPIGNSSDAVSMAWAVFGDLTHNAGQQYMHCSINDNGEFIVLLSRQGQNMFHSMMGLQRLTGSHATDTRNYVGIFDQTTSGRGAGGGSVIRSGVTYGMRRTNNASLMTAGGFSSPFYYGAGDGSTYGLDALSNKYNTWQLHHMCLTPQIHYNGTLPDFYVCGIAANCASVPSTAAQTWVLANNILVPMIDVVPNT